MIATPPAPAPAPAPALSYTWDNNGNLTARGSDSCSWDYEDRMTSATVGGTTTTFAYRGDGLRHSKTTGGNTTTFTWDVNAGLPVVLDDGSKYVYGAGLESMVTAGGTYYYLADGLGSTIAMVDTSGTVQKSYTYDVYGKATPTGSLANEFDFAGQETDGSTGLQYLRARYSDTETGRFISRDPLGLAPSQASNDFAYAACSPVRFGDAAGLKPTDGSEDRDQSARQKTCWKLASEIIDVVRQMNEDREVIEGRGDGRPVSDGQKRGKQRRWRNYQGRVQELWGRFEQLGCPDVIGFGWVPEGLEDALTGEYPAFKATTKSWWDKLPKPDLEWPEVPDDIWWNRKDGGWQPPIPGPVPVPVY